MQSTRLVKPLLIAIIALSTAFGAYLLANRSGRNTNTTITLAVDVTPTPTPDPYQPLNLLLIGYGGPGHDGGTLTDTMILTHLLPKQKKAILISIPRDLWVDLPLSSDNPDFGTKINAAFAIGNDDRYQKDSKYTGSEAGFKLVTDAVDIATGYRPTYIVGINFDGFINSIDKLGGVTVNVPYSFDDYFYPVKGKEDESCGRSEEDIAALTATMSGLKLEQEFPCRFETLHFDQGTQTMDGTTALKFVRSRHSSIGGSDFGRSQRQQALLIGLKNKIINPTNLLKTISAVQNLMPYINTNIDLEDLKQYASLTPDLTQYQIHTLSLSEDNILISGRSTDGQYILTPSNPDPNTIQNFLTNQIQAIATMSASPN